MQCVREFARDGQREKERRGQKRKGGDRERERRGQKAREGEKARERERGREGNRREERARERETEKWREKELIFFSGGGGAGTLIQYSASEVKYYSEATAHTDSIQELPDVWHCALETFVQYIKQTIVVCTLNSICIHLRGGGSIVD
jgi:uncharacterized membrane protein YdbT with pleckstrin-like domain